MRSNALAGVNVTIIVDTITALAAQPLRSRFTDYNSAARVFHPREGSGREGGDGIGEEGRRKGEKEKGW